VIDGPDLVDGDGDTSLSLLDRARANQQEAWKRIRELYAPLIFRWCRIARLEAEDAADVAQEVFLAAFKSLDSFRKEKPGDTFRGWLRTITRRKVYDWWTQENKQVRSLGGSDAVIQIQQLADPEETDDVPSSTDDGDERAVLVRKAVEMVLPEFPEWYAEVYRRLILAEQDPAEVAESLGVKRSAVYNAKSRILRRLRDEFRDLFEL
jgi:RNA polymerase sigma-70 factor (ECF subfamily)